MKAFILMVGNEPIGVLSKTIGPIKAHNMLKVAQLRAPIGQEARIIGVPTLRDDLTQIPDNPNLINFVNEIPNDELREQMLFMWQHWGEVCRALFDDEFHHNPDEVMSKIFELKEKK